MEDRVKIISAWDTAPPWDFTKQGVQRVPEYQSDFPSKENKDYIEFEMQFRGGVRSAIRIVGRLRDTEHVVYYEKH